MSVPDIGDYSDVPVIELLVQPGDSVAAEDAIVTLESDKATMDVPTTHAGVVRELLIKVGDRVSQGTVLMRIEAGAEASAPAPAAQAAALPRHPYPHPHPRRRPRGRAVRARSASPAAAPEAVSPPPASGKRAHASPSVRHYAREHGWTLPASRPAVATDASPAKTSSPTSRRRCRAAGGRPAGTGRCRFPCSSCCLGPRSISPGSVRSTAGRCRASRRSGCQPVAQLGGDPHVTNFDEADITDLEAFRNQINAENAKNPDAPKVTMLAFLIKACVPALKRFPEFMPASTART